MVRVGREAPPKVLIRVLTLTRSLNRDDTDGCCLLCDVCTVLAGSKEGLWWLWVGLQGPVGEGRLPTSRLILSRRSRCVVEIVSSGPDTRDSCSDGPSVVRKLM